MAVNNAANAQAQVGNPLLSQIRNFIDSDEPTPLDPIGIALRAVRGRLIRIGLYAFLAALVLAALAWLAIDPRFQSSGVIRILPREASLLYADADDSRMRLYDAFTTAEVQLMQSRAVMDSAWDLLHDRVHETTGPEFPIPENSAGLAQIFSLTNSRGLVTIRSDTIDPYLSAEAVNALIDAFESHKNSARTRVNDVRRSELQARESMLTESLQQLDERALEIGGEHDLTSLSRAHIAKTAQLEVLEERISEVDNTIAQFERTGSIGADDIRNAEIQRALVLDQAMAEMTYERAGRLADLSTLRRRYQPDHIRIRNAELELATLEAAIAERRDQITTLANVGALTGGTGQSSEQSLDELASVRDRLLQRRTDLGAEAAGLIADLVALRRIATEQERVAILLEETKQALDVVTVEGQTGVSKEMDIIARGKVSELPTEDKRAPIAFGAFLFGMMGTVAGFIALYLVNPRINYSDDLDRKLVGKIAVAIPAGTRDDGELRRASLRLRNEIDMRRDPGAVPVVVGVAGVSASEDTAALTLSLSGDFASRQLRVLVIDANAHGVISSRASLHDGAGLAEIVAAGQSLEAAIATVETDRGAIDVLASGGAGGSSEASVISSVTMRDFHSLIEQAAARYDVIIMDLGELSSGRHSALGASVAHQVVLVTAAGNLKRRVRNATDLLDRIVPDRYALVFSGASKQDPMLERNLRPASGIEGSTGFQAGFQKSGA